MNIKATICAKPFGAITQKQGNVIAQNILDRYCSPEYFNQENLEEIIKQTDCSCPNCGTSDFDGYCGWCKHKANTGINFYTDKPVKPQ